MTDDKRRDRLRFRSWHRGTREIDLILGSFADRYLHGFSDEEVGQFEDLLGENDPDLFDWITGAKPAPSPHDNHIMTLLQQHRFVDAKAV